jgi:N-acetylglucosamine-6-sulfatase
MTAGDLVPTMRGTRRALLGAVALVLVGLGALLSGSSSARAAQTTTKRPNIVFILVDDLDNTTMPFWKAMPQTRRLVASRGMEFTNNFVTNPVCCPSRASSLTGKYSHNTGVFDHTPPDGGYATFVQTGAEDDTLATRLQGAGYTTAFLGKYLNGYEETPDAVPPGWNEWFGLAGTYLDGFGYRANHNGKMETYGSRPRDYQTDVLSKQAQRFLDSTEQHDKKPFLLYLSPSAPHATIDAPPRDAKNRWTDAKLPRLPNYDEDDVSDKPSWLRLGKPQIGAPGTAAMTKRYRHAMASLGAVDDMVGALAHRLRDNGEFDNTVFVFVSDNGNSYGAHRLINKQVPYEESIRVPMAIAGPSIRHGTNDDLVTNIDQEPTVLELAGLDADARDDLDGRSLVPLLHGKDVPWRDDLLIEYHGTYTPLYTVDTFDQVRGITDRGASLLGPPTYRALRTKTQLFVEWYSGSDHEYELYDLTSDPYQLDNLVPDEAGLQAHAAEVAALRATLDQASTCSGPTCRAGPSA